MVYYLINNNLIIKIIKQNIKNQKKVQFPGEKKCGIFPPKLKVVGFPQNTNTEHN